MTNEKWWEDKPYCDQETHFYAPAGARMLSRGWGYDLKAIVLEAERRGYEKAMKEVREAVIPTAATLTLANEETIDVYYIPKSFVLR